MAADAATADSEKPASLVGYALSVLTTNSHIEKARLTREALDRWRTGLLPAFLPEDEATPPARPARDPSIQICDPGLAPKRGRGGTLTSRVALLHSLAHIESWAVDLSWDIIARFGRAEQMPRQFFDDWAIVAEDEARHFEALAMRLEEVGSRYGALPAHDGLWESATATAHSLAARLAVEHCTHEARGLDVLPQTIGRFRAGGDEASASLMENIIYPEEMTHCAKGVRWFRFLHQRQKAGAAAEDVDQLLRRIELSGGGKASDAATASEGGTCDIDDDGDAEVAAAFHDVVRRHFHGVLKPPFNDEARARAGFKPSWYLPLVTHRAASAPAAGGDGARSADGGGSPQAAGEKKRAACCA